MKSVQAQRDELLVGVLQSETSTDREKQKAFNALYAGHQKQIKFFFLKNVKDEELAEDLKMVTFEKVHENIKSFDCKNAFSTWMYKIALNTLIDSKRKDKFEVLSLDSLMKKTSDEYDGMEFQIESNTLSPEQEMIRKQNSASVLNAIHSISNDKIKKIMILRFIHELSFEEIAKIEGVDKDVSTLRVSVLRGQEILKSKLTRV